MHKDLPKNTFFEGPCQSLRNGERSGDETGAGKGHRSGEWGLDPVLWINTVPETSHEFSQPPSKWVVLPPSYRWRKGSSERLSSWPKITQQRDGKWKPKSRLTQSNTWALSGVPHCLWKFSLLSYWRGGQQFVVNRESRDLVPAWGPETKHFMSLDRGALSCIMRE